MLQAVLLLLSQHLKLHVLNRRHLNQLVGSILVAIRASFVDVVATLRPLLHTRVIFNEGYDLLLEGLKLLIHI